MSPRTPKQFEELRVKKREIILDAALHIFAEQGYHSASVSKIALAANISKGLIYNYFKSKEEMLFTIVHEIADQLLERFSLPNDTPSDSIIEKYIDNSFDLILEDPAKAKLFFSMYMQPQVMTLVSEKMMGRIVPFMEVMVKYFEIKGCKDPVSMMRFFSAAIDGVQMHIILDPNFPLEQSRNYLKQQFIYSFT